MIALYIQFNKNNFLSSLVLLQSWIIYGFFSGLNGPSRGYLAMGVGLGGHVISWSDNSLDIIVEMLVFF